MPDYFIPLDPEGIYHIFGRAIGSDKLFPRQENYLFFLEKFRLHTSGVADTFAYNLLPNHFHFLIRIKSLSEIENEYLKIKKNKPFTVEVAPGFIMKRFSNLSNAYTKSLNKVLIRRGSLLLPLRRVKIENDYDFASELFYVHKNAVHHGYAKTIEEWKWSSYKSLLSDRPTALLRKEVMEFFGGKEAFIIFHQQTIFPKNNDNEP